MVSREETGFELRLNRHFTASPERIWRAWTDPQALIRWFGPADTREVLQAQADVRVGGQYLIGFAMHDQTEHYASGIYQVVEPHRLLAFTWTWRETPTETSIVTVALTPTEHGTALELHQAPLVDQAKVDSHADGWGGCLTRLARELENKG